MRQTKLFSHRELTALLCQDTGNGYFVVKQLKGFMNEHIIVSH